MTDWTELYSIMINRYRFLHAIEECVPNVLTDLRENVFPPFKAIFCQTPTHIPGEWGIVVSESGVGGPGLWITWRSTKAALETGQRGTTFPSWASEFECEDLEADRAAVKRAVENWGKKHHLNVPWVKEEVFSTLRFWVRPHCPLTWQLRGADPAWGSPPIPHLHKVLSELTLRDERKRLQASKRDYESEVKKYFRLNSLYRGEIEVKKREHYRWAALFQCASYSPGRIAKLSDPIVESTVTKAIDNLFDIIELVKRPGRRGRKATSKM